ncbi:PREDICTED: ABC transporter G family member 38 [Lupinus angustifolius]|uniref:ABC transporter G family member 38 n=1 Tax=Lupinus angustifolius TaxID=3871 RepID=UPI00092F85B4|nr:PREDICTED: ABC transporter G family member 38 [Lupinus angustifolius]
MDIELKSHSSNRKYDEEEALKWAALERLSTYERARKGFLHGIAGDLKEIDIKKLGFQEKKELLESVVKHIDQNESYLKRLKRRIDRVSLNLPTIEVRFENLKIDTEAYVGKRALPSILNVILNVAETLGNYLHIFPNKKQKFSILSDVSGIIKPGRMTLLLGPPGSGKSTLLRALSGRIDSKLKVSGKVTYNGHELHEFESSRTSAYISQNDVHLPLLTVRETLAFSARCQGVGTGYDMLVELLSREKQLNITPDPYLDALMKASMVSGKKEDIVTAYILKILELEVCADTIVGDEMRRGVSGGQKKRVTTGEMLVGPVNVLFMDSISTGLDSSTTFQIVNCIRQSIHILGKSALISLLQPPPETFDLFDDVILLSEGQIVYQGPREHILEFFEFMGFKCPERKAVADYLQEVTSKKDQGQYWFNKEKPYRHISVDEFAKTFMSFHVGSAIQRELATPFDRSKSHPAALTKSKYGTNKKELLMACLEREFILTKRMAFVHIFRIIQMQISALCLAAIFSNVRKDHNTVEDGANYLSAIFFVVNTITFAGFFEVPIMVDKLPVFYKQRDQQFYPSWAFSLPASVLGIPKSIVEIFFWVAITYYTLGFDPSPTRMLRHFFLLLLNSLMACSLFTCIAATMRDHIVANTAGSVILLWILILGGFILSRENMPKWIIWGYWTSPLMYIQTGLSTNEFLGNTWNRVVNGSTETLGVAVLKLRGLQTQSYWYWIAVVVLVAVFFLFNVISALALTYLNEYGKSQSVFIPQETSDDEETKHRRNQDNRLLQSEASTSRTVDSMAHENPVQTVKSGTKRTILPFTPLCLTFENITYSVDMPKGMKSQGMLEERLELLKGLSGAFRPGVLTALMGVSGAGKTTLLDVLAGRKNTGYIEGNIMVSGYPKNQSTFARVSGYCEQNDIHSPLVTVHESLLFSAWLRLPADIERKTRELFVEEVMELVELTPLRDALVGFPNLNGLAIEQRKRLTIAVELVANPSIIFMDEPTSGLDARAAAIVMRTVRNTVDTGRTVVCTIHQPSIDIFESFDELFLLTRGGEEIYSGPIGPQSRHLIEYFQRISQVGRIRDGYNPATWALEVTTRAQEDLFGVKFSDIYKNSDLYRTNIALVRELSNPPPDSQDLHFPSKYSQTYLNQLKACVWKINKSYWRNTSYNAVRLLLSVAMSIMFGVLFLRLGSLRSTKEEIMNGVGSMYMAILFMGRNNAGTVRPVLLAERTVFYRERAAGMYSALPYAIAQVVIELPYTVVQVTIYAIIVYAMMGFQWTAAKFFLNLFFIFITILYFTYNGMALSAISPNQPFASILSSLMSTVWTLFAGFLIPTQKIAIWLRWLAWLCPTLWSMYGLVASQYADLQSKLYSGETVSEFMKDHYGFSYDFLWVVSLVLIGFSFVFAFAYIYGTAALNFQKR